ncbi:MAG: hypothetical protein K2P78_04120 [Gemmataceae bacterium]|nr:hypothetical protein [Gemmataceae bacterium]
MSTKYGFRGKIYFNTGTYNSPTWAEVASVRDVKVGAEMSEFEGSTRLAGGVEQTEPVILKLSLDGLIKSDEADVGGFVAMETAFLTRAATDVLILDGGSAVNGSRGYRVDMKVFKFGEDQALDKVLFREWSMKPGVSANAAYKAVVSSGAPVFTTLAS